MIREPAALLFIDDDLDCIECSVYIFWSNPVVIICQGVPCHDNKTPVLFADGQAGQGCDVAIALPVPPANKTGVPLTLSTSTPRYSNRVPTGRAPQLHPITNHAACQLVFGWRRRAHVPDVPAAAPAALVAILRTARGWICTKDMDNPVHVNGRLRCGRRGRCSMCFSCSRQCQARKPTTQISF